MELENQEATDPVDNAEVIENAENSESTEAVGEHPQPEKDEVSGHQAAINKQHHKFRQEERKNAELERELESFRAEKQKAEAELNQPKNVPDMPDYYDENYDEQLRLREQAIQHNAMNDARNQYAQQEQQQQQYKQQQEQSRALSEQIDSYTKKAIESGVSAQDLQIAGNIVAGYGLNPATEHAIMMDADGGLITTYLAANPLVGEKIRTMQHYDLAIFIEREVRGKAKELKPKRTSSPKPSDGITGGGADPDAGKYPFTKGATFS